MVSDESGEFPQDHWSQLSKRSRSHSDGICCCWFNSRYSLNATLNLSVEPHLAKLMPVVLVFCILSKTATNVLILGHNMYLVATLFDFGRIEYQIA